MTRPAVAVPTDPDTAKYYAAAYQPRAAVLAHFDAGTAALAELRRLS
jgi:hypothetical protein